FVALSLALCLYPISTSAQNPAVTVNVDAAADRRPINPNIYGVAHATAAELSDLNVPLNRNGGNNTTRYNWQLNADNRGNDWYYESIGDASATAGERGDTFIANARSTNAQALLTLPMIGWVAPHGTRRASGRPGQGRDQRQEDRLRRQDQSDRCDGARGRARGMGLERLLLQRRRSAVRQPARLERPSGSRQSRRRRLSALAAR